MSLPHARQFPETATSPLGWPFTATGFARNDAPHQAQCSNHSLSRYTLNLCGGVGGTIGVKRGSRGGPLVESCAWLRGLPSNKSASTTATERNAPTKGTRAA